MTRIADLSQNQLIAAFVADTQARIQNTQIQVSTGQKAQRYAGIADDAATLVNLESTDARTQQYIANNGVVTSRLNAMDSSLSQLTNIATQLKTLLVNANNASDASQMAINQQAQNLLNQTAGILNVKFGDSYLFSGTRTDVPPVNLSAPGYTAPGPTYPSTPDTGYYQGNSTQLVTRAADNFNVAYGVTANQGGFEELIRSLQLAATASTSPTIDHTRLQDALDVLNKAIGDLPNIRAGIGASQNAVDQATSQHNTMATYMEQTITNIKAVDVPSALTQLSSDQTVLQAAYMTTVRLSNLSLTQYMR
ncbi:MAG TPA: flagellin [Alphaproteobacteria bacterium]|jgi:flagellar hook-associated protein 3 FlgL|nr:flagellin [Alphaproteobacteria bacterium]